jgi:Fe-coproporphyrin III synthase
MEVFKNIHIKLFNHYQDIKLSFRELNYIDIEITKSCNMQCRHCYMNAILWEDESELSKKEWFSFFDDLKNTYWTRIRIVFSWWETLIKKDIFEILKYIKIIWFKDISLITNWLLLNEKNIKKLDNLITNIWISLDWFEEEHNYFRKWDVFKRTIENIKKIKKHSNIKLIIKTTIFNKNCNYLDEFYKFIKKLDAYTWHFYPMEPIW